ncbi:MAG: diaminopimelate epimerase [Pseudonocardiales bacterium]
MRYLKGHGTGNDFVVLPDPDNVPLTPSLVRALCDRRFGIGADGVLRVVRDGALWFMDYRNADGSIAEMCGNGIRLYARYLVDAGLAEPGSLEVATRDGVKQVSLDRFGDVTVQMGQAKVDGAATAGLGDRSCQGILVDIGNPHLVCVVDGPVTDFDLTAAPIVDSALFPDGVNVEVVTGVGERHLQMRAFERGVGETRSCGTGACAAVAAASRQTGEADGEWIVDVPGGRLVVTLEGDRVQLTGPAVVVASGVIDEGWLSSIGR